MFSDKVDIAVQKYVYVYSYRFWTGFTYIEIVDNNKIIYTAYLCLGLINVILIVLSHYIINHQTFSQTMIKWNIRFFWKELSKCQRSHFRESAPVLSLYGRRADEKNVLLNETAPCTHLYCWLYATVLFKMTCGQERKRV